RQNLTQGVRAEIIPDFFRLTLNYNKGIAWGMLPEWSEYFTYFAIVMVLVILLIFKKLDKDEVWLKIALAFQMAGAIGNMTDRLIRHKVTDFIDVTLFPHTNFYHSWHIFNKTFEFGLPYDWPIFNLADSFVVVGTIVLVMVLMSTTDKDSATAKQVSILLGSTDDSESPGLSDNSEWSVHPTETGCITAEEALVELKDPQASDKLRPFEEIYKFDSQSEESYENLPGERDPGREDPDRSGEDSEES
ncbi:MAG: signal peptidase II, partial [bacterium]